MGKRQIPFGFGWLKEGSNPYRELPVRAIRLAFRELTANPDLPDPELRARLGRELFGANWHPAQVDDLFELFRVCNIAERHRDAPNDGAKELHRIAQWLAEQWTTENLPLLNPG